MPPDPSEGALPSREVRKLSVVGRRMFLGEGDYQLNTGPRPVLWLDLDHTDEGVQQGPMLATEQTRQYFKDTSGRIWTPFIDPRGGYGTDVGQAAYSDDDGDTWHVASFTPYGWHIFSMLEFDGRIFAFGSSQTGPNYPADVYSQIWSCPVGQTPPVFTSSLAVGPVSTDDAAFHGAAVEGQLFTTSPADSVTHYLEAGSNTWQVQGQDEPVIGQSLPIPAATPYALTATDIHLGMISAKRPVADQASEAAITAALPFSGRAWDRVDFCLDAEGTAYVLTVMFGEVPTVWRFRDSAWTALPIAFSLANALDYASSIAVDTVLRWLYVGMSDARICRVRLP